MLGRRKGEEDADGYVPLVSDTRGGVGLSVRRGGNRRARALGWGNGPGRCCWFAGPKPRVGRGGGGAWLQLLGREKESGPRGEGSGPSAEREGFPLFISIFFSIF